MSNLSLISTRMNTLGFSVNVISHVLDFVKNNQISDSLSRIGKQLQLFIPLRVGFLFISTQSDRVVICLPVINRYVGFGGTINTRDIVIKNTSKTAHLKLQKKYDEKITNLKNQIFDTTLQHNRQIINGLLSVVTHGTTIDYIDLSNKINDIMVSVGNSSKDNMFDAP